MELAAVSACLLSTNSGNGDGKCSAFIGVRLLHAREVSINGYNVTILITFACVLC